LTPRGQTAKSWDTPENHPDKSTPASFGQVPLLATSQRDNVGRHPHHQFDPWAVGQFESSNHAREQRERAKNEIHCGIDIVVANVSALAAAEDSEASWQAEFDVDMMHTVRTVNAAMAHLEKSKHAAIVIVSSVSGREIDFTSPAYGAFKGALIHYSHGLAHKLAPKGIRVNAVSPGNTYFKGGIWNYVEDNMPDLFKSSIAMNPTGRMATPEEIGKGIVFLASPASSFTMGTNLVIDGALTKGVQF
jgi:NAD(P)-dependent dehydrogenase (short-subunit alcohol dehydrogenase family)